MKIQEIISHHYKELAAQLGDAYFTLSKLKLKIKQLEHQMEGLNMATPIAVSAEMQSKLEKKEEKNEQ